ncbi:hypothetical protein G3N55_10680 [Dissulfurirhabdus thermomarina]|uniref:Uncharacterized protein n=1 Tax=Dissulfurirhabdus thermomarina TaxID=1765737 RepID=A0A6N9TT90_DISTH|nr:hypothetical protein [Dissulfurirhabdus thermomarina]NDY43303.1 hypothetical protein [Dissulfurirhabdus thermomarina]NMX22786.1 hypothetical protein [Dissulfurirhabdus thermomarina]
MEPEPRITCPHPTPGGRVPVRFPAWVTWAAFGVGLTGAISLRLILVAKAYDPDLIRLFWYIGVCGNMLFFLFRSYITQRRRRVILSLDLPAKLQDEARLCPEDYEALRYLVASLMASKERWNYFVISAFSLAAIAWDLWWHAR